MSEDRRDERLERLAGLMAGRRLVEPPAGVLRKAMALGDLLGAKPSLVDRICELLFDSGSEPLPVGVRGAATEERRLLYRLGGGEFEEAELDLRLRREAGGTVELTGQLLPPHEGAAVELRSGTRTRKIQLAEGGEFLARNLPGTIPLELVVVAGNGVPIRVGELPLPQAGAN